MIKLLSMEILSDNRTNVAGKCTRCSIRRARFLLDKSVRNYVYFL